MGRPDAAGESEGFACQECQEALIAAPTAKAASLGMRLQRHALPALAFAICAWHFADFFELDRPLLTDVRYYVYFSWWTSEGAVPHLDYFGNKTQLAALVGSVVHYVGALFGDPLIAVRIAFLAFAGVGGLLAYQIHRRLCCDRGVAGLVGVLVYCGFPLLGILPAMGVIPKLLMAVFASAAAVAVFHRRWFWAGVASAISFMDWQVGGLAGAGALLAAGICGRPRLGATAQVVLGGIVGITPFLLYYAWNGALGVTLEHVVGASFARGASSMAETTVAQRWESMQELATFAGASYPPLFQASALGLPVAGWWLWKRRGSAAEPMLICLTLHHAGVLAFSFLDFQRYGDFFLVLHAVAFFLALAINGLYELALQPFVGPSTADGRSRTVVAVAVLVATAVLARPGPLRPPEVLPIPGVDPQLTLADQREVAHKIESELGDGRLAFLQNIEVAYFMRYANPLPFGYWNFATWSVSRSSESESRGKTAVRLLESLDPDAFAASRQMVRDRMPEYRRRSFESESGRYSVTLYVRDPSEVR